MIPTLEERIEFWKFLHALDCFEQAHVQCDYVLKEKDNIPHSLYRNVLTSFYVVYAKPFKRSNGLPKLPEDIVPASYLYLHKEILHYRDKIFAHADIDGKNDVVGEYLDHVELHVENGKTRWHNTSLFPSTDRFAEYKKLCAELATKMEYHQMKLSEKWRKNGFYPLEDGIYRLNVRESDNPVMYHRIENPPYPIGS